MTIPSENHNHPKDHKTLRRKLRRDATFPERLLWSKLRRRQTGFKFRRQESIGPYIVDFICTELSLIVEVDGVSHTDPKVRAYDKARENFLIEQGYKILHYSDQEVIENLEGVCLDIQKHCQDQKRQAPL